MTRISIFLITVALIIGMVGYGGCNGPDPYADYIKIYDWTDLDDIRNNPKAKYVLMNNLDSSTTGYTELASPTANGGKGWEPIGIWDRPSRFYGTLDGQGYEIRDLFIARPDDDYVGLFGTVGSNVNHTPVIRNVGVVNADVSGGDYRVGALIGSNWGSVLSCYSTGSVSGGHYVGGLVGLNDGGGNIVPAAAIIYDFNSADAIIDNSYSAASVSGYKSCVGGLLGSNSAGALSRSYSTGNVVGQTSVGGLVGCNAGGLSSGGIVSKCYSTGDVTGQTLVGGLVGTNSARYSYGGIVSQCYSTGNVVGNSPVGGLVGENNNGNVSNSFWDTETSGQATSDGGMGKNTAEMQDITTFSYASWYIGAVANPSTRNPYYTWNIVDGETYPFFRWEPVS
jgi:hypothetical protein